MTSQPRTSPIDKSFERLTLFISLRKIIQPDDHIVVRQVVIIQVCPIGSRVKGKALLARNQIKEVQAIPGKIHVIHFTSRGIESRYFKSRLLRACLDNEQE
jgi:hypothetical protein